MSNLLFMDESNGNGVYASRSNNAAATGATAATTATATATATSNINNIKNAAATTLPTSVSSEDLSQSLSEYTDADESISAPTEVLAEFLSAVMLKEYKKALKYCKLILQYEPNNSSANEFYPLIQEKLKENAIIVNSNSDSDENYNKSSSPEMGLDGLQVSSDEASDDQQAAGGDLYDFVNTEDNLSGENISGSSDSGGGGGGKNEDEDHDDDDDNDDDDDDDDEDGDEHDIELESEDGEDSDDDEDDNDEDEIEDEDDDGDVCGDGEEEVNSSSGDDLPIDGKHLLGADVGGRGSNGSNSSHNSSCGGEGRSRSDNTTHSYSSLLLEEDEEDDIVTANLKFGKQLSSADLDVSNGNKVNSASCSDSESPTEPLTQRLAAILRSKCGVSSDCNNY